MLCFNCNQALGNVRDDPKVLTNLRDYLLLSRQFPREQALALSALERRLAVHIYIHNFDVSLEGYVHDRTRPAPRANLD